MPARTISDLPAFENGSKFTNVVIEASKGSRIKLKYDSEYNVFRAEKFLPLGLVFPFDFGFLPSTLAADGDPLDVLIISETALPAKTVVLSQILQIVKCTQKENGKTQRNDRIVAVPIDGKSHKPMQPVVKLNSILLDSISHFFVEYNKLQGKTFHVIGVEGMRSAMATIQKGIAAAKKQ
jgi:inorganic pyrophosphatase